MHHYNNWQYPYVSALILYRPRLFINHLLTYLLSYLLTSRHQVRLRQTPGCASLLSIVLRVNDCSFICRAHYTIHQLLVTRNATTVESNVTAREMANRPGIRCYNVFNTHNFIKNENWRQLTVGWLVAQWQNVGLWPANFPCPAVDLQLTGAHLCK